MAALELSLAVVGTDFPNSKKRGPTRRFAVGLCRPGDPVELRRELKNEFDEFAIAVHNREGMMMGYIRSERAAFIAPMLDRGREVQAIFQEETHYGAVIRAAFDGVVPT